MQPADPVADRKSARIGRQRASAQSDDADSASPQPTSSSSAAAAASDSPAVSQRLFFIAPSHPSPHASTGHAQAQVSLKPFALELKYAAGGAEELVFQLAVKLGEASNQKRTNEYSSVTRVAMQELRSLQSAAERTAPTAAVTASYRSRQSREAESADQAKDRLIGVVPVKTDAACADSNPVLCAEPLADGSRGLLENVVTLGSMIVAGKSSQNYILLQCGRPYSIRVPFRRAPRRGSAAAAASSASAAAAVGGLASEVVAASSLQLRTWKHEVLAIPIWPTLDEAQATMPSPIPTSPAPETVASSKRRQHGKKRKSATTTAAAAAAAAVKDEADDGEATPSSASPKRQRSDRRAKAELATGLQSEDEQAADPTAMVAASAFSSSQSYQRVDAGSGMTSQMTIQTQLAAAAFSSGGMHTRSGLPPRTPNIFSRGNASSSDSSQESTGQDVLAPPQGHASSFSLVPDPQLSSLLSTPRQSSPIIIPSPGSAAMPMDVPMLDGELQPPLPQSAYPATPARSPYRHDESGGSRLSGSDGADQSLRHDSLPAMDTSSSSNDTSHSSGTAADFLPITPMRHSHVDSDASTPETGLRTPRRYRSGRDQAAMLNLTPSLGSPTLGSAIGRARGILAASSALGALRHPAEFSSEELSDKENSATVGGRPSTRGHAAAAAAESSPSSSYAAVAQMTMLRSSLRPPLMPRPGHELASRASAQAVEDEAAAASRSQTAGQASQLYQHRLRRTLLP